MVNTETVFDTKFLFSVLDTFQKEPDEVSDTETHLVVEFIEELFYKAFSQYWNGEKISEYDYYSARVDTEKVNYPLFHIMAETWDLVENKNISRPDLQWINYLRSRQG